MIFRIKHFNFYLFIFIIIFTHSCQLNDAKNKHGIAFLENRAEKLRVNYSNTNDVINIFGQPHSKGFENKLEWIYIERVFEKGKFYKLGRNVLKTNNVLVLDFNKYGVLEKKIFLNKNDLKKMTFTRNVTVNDLAKKSFIEKFLSSVRSKMYENR